MCSGILVRRCGVASGADFPPMPRKAWAGPAEAVITTKAAATPMKATEALRRQAATRAPTLVTYGIHMHGVVFDANVSVDTSR